MKRLKKERTSILMEFKTIEEMKYMNESEVISYSTALMNRKLELADAAAYERNNIKAGLAEANQISDQIKLLAETRKVSTSKRQ